MRVGERRRSRGLNHTVGKRKKIKGDGGERGGERERGKGGGGGMVRGKEIYV